MSYARLSTDDVYVFLTLRDDRDVFTCCGCWLDNQSRQFFTTTAAIVAHLNEHRAAGHMVRDKTYADLLDDAEVNDALMNPPAGIDMGPIRAAWEAKQLERIEREKDGR